MRTFLSFLAAAALTVTSGPTAEAAPKVKTTPGHLRHQQTGIAGSPRAQSKAGTEDPTHGGFMHIMSNGTPAPPTYETGIPTSSTGYVRVYLSKLTPTPPKTTWYLDGVSKGTVTKLASAAFKSATRTGHTISFTCLGNNKPPAAVDVDLGPYQKVTIPISYK